MQAAEVGVESASEYTHGFSQTEMLWVPGKSLIKEARPTL